MPVKDACNVTCWQFRVGLLFFLCVLGARIFAQENDDPIPIQGLQNYWTQAIENGRFFVVPVDSFDIEDRYSFGRFVRFFVHDGQVIDAVSKPTPTEWFGVPIDCPHKKLNIPVPFQVGNLSGDSVVTGQARAVQLDVVKADGVIEIGRNAPYEFSLNLESGDCVIRRKNSGAGTECSLYREADLIHQREDLGSYKQKLSNVFSNFYKQCVREDSSDTWDIKMRELNQKFQRQMQENLSQ